MDSFMMSSLQEEILYLKQVAHIVTFHVFMHKKKWRPTT